MTGTPAGTRARMWDKGGRPGRERPMVPKAEFRSYYGRPVIKKPVWKWDIPAYFLTGGLMAGSSLLGAGADLTGNRPLRRAARMAAAANLGASTWFLIHDLGRPARFMNMLRVFKPTSPMSLGTWLLAAYGPSAGLAAVSEATGRLTGAGRAGGLAAAALAPAVATYTAVLAADTAVPSWHDAYRHLPFVFAGSAAAASGGLAMALAPPSAGRGRAGRRRPHGAHHRAVRTALPRGSGGPAQPLGPGPDRGRGGRRRHSRAPKQAGVGGVGGGAGGGIGLHPFRRLQGRGAVGPGPQVHGRPSTGAGGSGAGGEGRTMTGDGPGDLPRGRRCRAPPRRPVASPA